MYNQILLYLQEGDWNGVGSEYCIMKLFNRKRFVMLNKFWDICIIYMSRFYKVGVELSVCLYIFGL